MNLRRATLNVVPYAARRSARVPAVPVTEGQIQGPGSETTGTRYRTLRGVSVPFSPDKETTAISISPPGRIRRGGTTSAICICGVV